MGLPFVYICSLMRTGSTFLQELLTDPPRSLILSEPRFNGTNFYPNKENKQQITSAGLIVPITSEISSFFRYLNTKVEQVGVKEIRNQGWTKYIEAFGNNIRIILTARDPRDIYLSAAGVIRRGSSWNPKFGFNPEGLYKELLPEIEIQNQLMCHKSSVKVRYEDLCSDFESKYKEIKDFIISSVSGIGSVGEFHKTTLAGQYVVSMHNSKVTTKSVGRWKRETDKQLIKDANIFYELMSDYSNLWGY